MGIQHVYEDFNLWKRCLITVRSKRLILHALVGAHTHIFIPPRLGTPVVPRCGIFAHTPHGVPEDDFYTFWYSISQIAWKETLTFIQVYLPWILP
jgi:hypothetical protein